MANFQYSISDRAGATGTGVIEAENLGDALRKLRRDGNHVLSIEPAGEATAENESPLLPRRVTRKEIIGVTNELAIMVQTGVTLSDALGSIAEQNDNPSLVRVVRDLKAHVESGEDFSAALARHPKLFDKTYVQLIKASEASGSMGLMLERIVESGRRQLDSQGKVKAALAYPAVMMLASIAASIFLLAYVFPKFTPLFSVRGIALPLPTRIMIALSDALVHRWYFFVLGVVALVTAVVLLLKSASGRRLKDRVMLRIPVLGSTFRQAALSRSLRTLATMLGSGVPMLQAIRLCAEVSGNSVYEDEWGVVAEGVTAGRQIHEIMGASARFPKSLTQMIAAGELTGRLGPVLNRLSDHYDRELENTVKAATSLIEPIMVCFMGIVVGSVALALLLPIFTLSRQVA